jgi:hypothetical protein
MRCSYRLTVLPESQNVTWNETCARIAKNHTDTCLWEHWGNDNL